jgi:hypothetical protein
VHCTMKRHTNTLLQHALVADTICTLCSVLAALDLASEPNTGANGVHASAGPLEGLRERMVLLKVHCRLRTHGSTRCHSTRQW